MHPNVAGALLNSAIYLLCVFVAGIVTAHPFAWKEALVAMGITYLSHYAGMNVALGKHQHQPALLYIANLPLRASVLSMTVMATDMPFLGRG